MGELLLKKVAPCVSEAYLATSIFRCKFNDIGRRLHHDTTVIFLLLLLFFMPYREGSQPLYLDLPVDFQLSRDECSDFLFNLLVCHNHHQCKVNPPNS